jgi:hypothetical protein
MKKALSHIGKVLGGIGLLILAFILTLLIAIPALVWKVYVSITEENRKAREILTGTFRFFLSMAVSIDKFGNCAYGGFFNDLLLITRVYEFGNTHETISEVLGWANHFDDLTPLGIKLHNILNWLDDNHCEKARLHGIKLAEKKLALTSSTHSENLKLKLT